MIDAKYKPITDSRFPNADAYKMLAYCQAFRLSHGTLVYARGEVREQIHTLPAGVKLRVAAVDVEREPAELLSQVHDLAASIA